MVEINWLVTALAALIPMVVGSIWYNPKVLGGAWMKSTGLTEEELRKANMGVIFGLSLVFSFLISLMLNPMVIHQFAIGSIMMGEPGFGKEGSELTLYLNNFMDKYGDNYRSFSHGVTHGSILGLLFVTPIIGTLALFERKGAKYIFLHAGYWIISLALMGGVIAHFT